MILRKIDEQTRYFPAAPIQDFSNPAHKEIKHMLHLVAYDIANPKRLRRVAQTCEDFGIRVEYSVFECDLPPDRFEHFWKQLLLQIDPKNDALLAYRICAECVKKARVGGVALRPDPPNVFIF